MCTTPLTPKFSILRPMSRWTTSPQGTPHSSRTPTALLFSTHSRVLRRNFRYTPGSSCDPHCSTAYRRLSAPNTPSQARNLRIGGGIVDRICAACRRATKHKSDYNWRTQTPSTLCSLRRSNHVQRRRQTIEFVVTTQPPRKRTSANSPCLRARIWKYCMVTLTCVLYQPRETTQKNPYVPAGKQTL